MASRLAQFLRPNRLALKPVWLALVALEAVFVALPYLPYSPETEPTPGLVIVEEINGTTHRTPPALMPIPRMAGLAPEHRDFSPTCRVFCGLAAVLNIPTALVADVLFLPFERLLVHPTLCVPISRFYAVLIALLFGAQWFLAYPRLAQLIWDQRPVPTNNGSKSTSAA